MEILSYYVLPREFRPVLELCNEIEQNLFIEYKCTIKLKESNYKNIVDNLIFEPEIEDDLDFIVRMQNECGIANDTTKERAEWYYTFASIRTIENYSKLYKEYYKYIDTINNLQFNLRLKIYSIKNMIIEIYQNYIFNTSYDDIYNMVNQISHVKNYNLDKDFVWERKNSSNPLSFRKSSGKYPEFNYVDNDINCTIDKIVSIAEKKSIVDSLEKLIRDHSIKLKDLI
jgi:hypothetical protein